MTSSPFVFHALAPDQTIVWAPQAGPQTELLRCPVFEVFFGGARGGGKTEASLGDWLQHSAMYGEAAIGLFVRRKLTQLAEVIARAKQIFTKLGAKYNEQAKTFTMANGARLRFAYLERDIDAEEYQGHNYTRLYVEEVTQFPSPAPINKLRATLRSAAGVPVGMRLTGNPGGAGHNWVKKRYIDPDPRGFRLIRDKEILEYDGKRIEIVLDRVFIPSKIGDNRLLMENDPTYILKLRQSGSAALVEAWLKGNWDIIDGAFFNEWGPEHVLSTTEWLRRIPHHAQVYRAFDWGSAKPFSVGWYAISDGLWGLPRGALVKFREWYGSSGLGDNANVGLKLDAKVVAQGILNRERAANFPWQVQFGIADPAIFIRDGGPSIAEDMIKEGCSWRRADNKRIPGWTRLRQMLVGEGGLPMLYFLDCCIDSIRTIPTLQHDEKDAEDLDTDAEDHAADETRYAVMARSHLNEPSDMGEAFDLPPLPHETTINALIEQRTIRRLAYEADHT